MCAGAPNPISSSGIWLKAQSQSRPSQPTETVFRRTTDAAAAGLKAVTRRARQPSWFPVSSRKSRKRLIGRFASAKRLTAA